jgi:Family of unknown function (DUF6125)
MTDIQDINEMSREELRGLLRDAALNWLAHDGLWFRAVEDAHGLETAMELDRKAWEQFTVIEAKRIMRRLGLAPGGGIEALVRALSFRLYAHVNVQEVAEVTAARCLFRMKNCRVQEARQRQGLADFPCKSVGLVEYAGFARAIDPRIETRCLVCPPDPHPADSWCAWEFTIPEKL